MSPLGDEIIFNINDISWKDVAVFMSKDEMDTKSDLIVRRGFSIAPLSQEKQGFQDTWMPEMNVSGEKNEGRKVVLETPEMWAWDAVGAKVCMQNVLKFS